MDSLKKHEEIINPDEVINNDFLDKMVIVRKFKITIDDLKSNNIVNEKQYKKMFNTWVELIKEYL